MILAPDVKAQTANGQMQTLKWPKPQMELTANGPDRKWPQLQIATDNCKWVWPQMAPTANGQLQMANLKLDRLQMAQTANGKSQMGLTANRHSKPQMALTGNGQIANFWQQTANRKWHHHKLVNDRTVRFGWPNHRTRVVWWVRPNYRTMVVRSTEPKPNQFQPIFNVFFSFHERFRYLCWF